MKLYVYVRFLFRSKHYSRPNTRRFSPGIRG